MSYELYQGKKYLGMLGTNKGVADMSGWAEAAGLKALDAFFFNGTSSDIDALQKDVQAAINRIEGNNDLLDSFKNLGTMLKSASGTVSIV